MSNKKELVMQIPVKEYEHLKKCEEKLRELYNKVFELNDFALRGRNMMCFLDELNRGKYE